VRLALLRAPSPAVRWQIAAVALTLVVVVAGKQYYRDATAADLRWILAPTAQLVSWITAADFVHEAGVGYSDLAVGFVIAPPCAGLNFALAAFLALALGALPGMTSARAVAVRLAGAAALAFAATLVVNTLRIALAVGMRRGTIDVSGLDRDQLHHAVGIAVYLGGLCALYAAARAVAAGRRRALAA
jgi:exosortase K